MSVSEDEFWLFGIERKWNHAQCVPFHRVFFNQHHSPENFFHPSSVSVFSVSLFQSNFLLVCLAFSILLPPPPFFPRLLTPCLSPSLPVPLPHIYQIPPMCPMPFQAPWTDTVVNKTRTKFLPSKKKKKKILAPWNLFRWRHNAKQHKLS